MTLAQNIRRALTLPVLGTWPDKLLVFPGRKGRVKGVSQCQEEIAALLRVSRQHLSMVRHGRRKSKLLLKRYNQFLKEAA